jgi:hypothetical protein
VEVKARRARGERIDDRSAEFDFRREERAAAAQERRDAARENDERDAANRPGQVVNELAKMELGRGNVDAARELGMRIPDTPATRQVMAEAAGDAVVRARADYLNMARQLVRDLPAGAAMGGLQAKMEALQNGVRRRYAGDPQAAAQLAGAIQGAVADELDQRRRGGFKTGLDLARKQRPHLVQRDPQTGREISVAPVDGPTGLVGDVNQALRRTGQLPPGFAIEWR